PAISALSLHDALPILKPLKHSDIVTTLVPHGLEVEKSVLAMYSFVFPSAGCQLDSQLVTRRQLDEPATSKCRELNIEMLCLCFRDRKSTRLNSSHVKI